MRVNWGNHFDLRRCAPMSREEEHRCGVEYVKTKDDLEPPLKKRRYDEPIVLPIAKSAVPGLERPMVLQGV